ncbi:MULTISPECIES: class I SAM-dependent methyltransferase [Leptospira]|uniref:Nodulation protein S NodS n=1 Tax=Leptospira weilii str. 2006001855 TaxID=996804 RepID=M6FQG5_9LEPT|nr:MULTISPECIES: class I SAM-dependent methyltransferase [Leptospira]EMJ63858.1 nodulation protein S NodS [Leptospira sp. P2653]EMM74998.1 nodulation protein S NodS [Leptospira weilii str. 2006001855]MCL8265901.1 class I SAM-dependent methyltransferase [Leptospira weilii]
MKKQIDYHDYVIKDGEFVGKFEEMYSSCDDPWYQTKRESILGCASKLVSTSYMLRFGIKEIIEFGCGLGFYTSFLRDFTGAKVAGVDISETAIRKAKEYFGDMDFFCDDIEFLGKYSEYKNIMFSELTWYILEDNKLLYAFENIAKHFKGGYFIHNLQFYEKGQKYGIDFFTNLAGFIKLCPFELISFSETKYPGSENIETSCIFKID